MKPEIVQNLIKSLDRFNFTNSKSTKFPCITSAQIMQIILDVNKDYRKYSITIQTYRILILPFTLIFVVNSTIIMMPFLEVYSRIKEFIVSNGIPYDERINRIIINKNEIILDFTPTSKIKYGYKFFLLKRNLLILNEDSISKLDYFSEVEVKFKDDGADFELSKFV